jgi:hypothetical protein
LLFKPDSPPNDDAPELPVLGLELCYMVGVTEEDEVDLA